ncbi:MAG: glucose-6-phosphate dehydrogenase [Elusimicrobiota bacterium]
MGEARLTDFSESQNEWSRVIIEKPFGFSFDSANKLNEEIKNVLREKQIYRIDHYLGKETVQNIMMFRFANILFEPVWNRNYIDHIQITASEKLGVEHRAGYYEQTGILRDMFQNHLLQILALIAMEPPSGQDADTVRDKRVEVFKCFRSLSNPVMEQNTICGQYAAGFIDGNEVCGYRQEKNVNPKSITPTYAAIRFELDNWRWQGVPFYMRAGKRLEDRLVEVVVHFKRVPASIFTPLFADQLSANILKFRIQPDEGITIQFEAKHPGPKLCMSTVTMDFGYQKTFKTPPPESYARLLHDAMVGDQTLFARSDEILQSWRIIDPVIKYWEAKSHFDLPLYPAGSWGPKESDMLLAKSGRSWY